MTRDIEFRLLQHDSASGELLARDAISLIRSFNELAYRLTRAVADRPGLGRSEAVLERLSKVRVSLREGSTRVVFKVGDTDALDLDDPISRDVDAAFWEIAQGVQQNRRPESVSDSVAEAVDGVIAAIRVAAPITEITVPGHGLVSLKTDEVWREPWKRRDVAEPVVSTVHGVLEMVDLRSARFRLRDAAHNSIDLIDVRNPPDVARLVGELVTATGLFTIGRGSDHHRVDNAMVEAAKIRIVPDVSFSMEDAVLVARAKTAPPPMELTTDEVTSFLAAVHG